MTAVLVLTVCVGKGLSVEWVRFARVNTVSPGYINTELIKFVPEDMKKLWREKIPVRKDLVVACCRTSRADMSPDGS